MKAIVISLFMLATTACGSSGWVKSEIPHVEVPDAEVYVAVADELPERVRDELSWLDADFDELRERFRVQPRETAHDLVEQLKLDDLMTGNLERQRQILTEYEDSVSDRATREDTIDHWLGILKWDKIVVQETLDCMTRS